MRSPAAAWRRSGARATSGRPARGSHGIDAAAGSGAVVESAGNVRVDGSRADGVHVHTQSGDARVVSAGDLAAIGDYSNAIHLDAHTDGVATIQSVGRLSARGSEARGIDGRVYDRAVLNVDSRGDIAVEGMAGILLTAFGDGGVTLSSAGNVTVAGEGADGIAVASQAGNVAVTSGGNIAVRGSLATGISAAGVNAGIHSRGDITLDGSAAVGIMASATGPVAGVAAVESARDVTMTGVGATGLYARSLLGAAGITITSGTVTGGSGDGFAVGLAAAAQGTIENRGTLQALSGRAIVNADGGGPLTVANLGTVIGFVNLNDGEDDFDNRGRFAARGNSDFGTGLDAMVNSGTLRVGDANGTEDAAFLGLESFTNGPSGVITMINGRAGDRLRFPALDNFNGGGVLEVDAVLAGTGSPADLLTLSGWSAARQWSM